MTHKFSGDYIYARRCGILAAQRNIQKLDCQIAELMHQRAKKEQDIQKFTEEIDYALQYGAKE